MRIAGMATAAALVLVATGALAAAAPGYDDMAGLRARLGAATVRSAETVGALGDGRHDDTAALQIWLDHPHAVLQLTPGRSYRLTRSLVLGAGRGIVGYGARPGRLVMSASGFDCDVARGCANYMTGSNAVGILARGAPGAPLRGLVLDDFAIVGEGAAQRGKTLMAITCLDVADLRIARLDISRLTNAIGIRCSGLGGHSVIERNAIHDFADDSPGPLPNLMAGILIDGDSGDAISSTTALALTANTVTNIRYGAVFAARYMQQSSGIVTITGGHGIVATRNIVAGVGQGFDWHASNGTLSDNTVRDADLFCLKFIHGASDNIVTGNMLTGCGIAGISLGGGNSTLAVARNRISGNVIRGIDFAGAFAAHTTAGIILLASTRGGASTDNRIGPNDIDSATAKWAIGDFGPADRGNTIRVSPQTRPGLEGVAKALPGTATVE